MTIDTRMEHQRELTDKLAEACYYYEVLNKELMSNKEYDALYDELLKIEQENGVVLSNSPTHKVGYEVMSQLKKVEHETPMLSLDKTKDKDTIKGKFLDKNVDVSFKLDGLTVVLTYENGELKQAVTRGNGLIGEDVTHTVKHSKGVPARIPYLGKLVLRGEAIISYDDFNSINDSIANAEEKYKNPRNLASGTVRSLDSEIARDRKLRVVIFEVLTGESDSKADRLEAAKSYGFEVVDFMQVVGDNVVGAIDTMTEKAKILGLPVDGLVVTIDSIRESEALGTTGKFPRSSMAFKWADTTAETVLRDIEWSMARTGVLTPVAIFDPVELEGTTVTRASLHNLSYAEDLELGIGDRITVYKANMIIPQIDQNLTRSGFDSFPTECPLCGGKVTPIRNKNTSVVVCCNKNCPGKTLGKLSHFVSRDAMNIRGLSEGILDTLMINGIIASYADIYRIEDKADELLKIEGMGAVKLSNLLDAIEDSRTPKLANFINAIGIPNVGIVQSKAIAKEFGNWENFYLEVTDNYTGRLGKIPGIGAEIEDSVLYYFHKYSGDVEELLLYVEPQDYEYASTNSAVAGKTFVITGNVYQFKNRKELQDKIEELGGKTTGSVSNKTDYLINNDVTSTSNKNKKAKELGVAIISEQDFLNMIGN